MHSTVYGSAKHRKNKSTNCLLNLDMKDKINEKSK